MSGKTKDKVRGETRSSTSHNDVYFLGCTRGVASVDLIAGYLN